MLPKEPGEGGSPRRREELGTCSGVSGLGGVVFLKLRDRAAWTFGKGRTGVVIGGCRFCGVECWLPVAGAVGEAGGGVILSKAPFAPIRA
jgi:hypothetical protein